MGLALQLGMLNSLKGSDPERYQHYRQVFSAVNAVLARHQLPVWQEPETFTTSFNLIGYTNLHYLRRIAVYRWKGAQIPEPGTDENIRNEDPLLEEYYMMMGAGGAADVRHLMCHSDSEGVYVPIDFLDPIYCSDIDQVPGDIICSSHRLKSECELLADYIELPLETEPEDAFDALESPPTQKWHRYGKESFACLSLWRAASLSIQYSTAIVFC